MRKAMPINIDGSPRGLGDMSIVPVAADDAVESEPAVLDGVQRALYLADNTDIDIQANDLADNSGFAVVEIQPGDEEQDYRMRSPGPTSAEHLSTHLPRLKDCPICDDGNTCTVTSCGARSPWCTSRDQTRRHSPSGPWFICIVSRSAEALWLSARRSVP